MTLSRPLLWKESRESKAILILGTIIFLVLPLIGAVEHLIQYRRFELWTAPWVIGLGGFLAAVAGVGVIIPDITRRFEFIRSQPIPLARWVLTKYLVGLAVIEFTLIVPLAIELVQHRDADFSGFYPPAMLITLPFTWAAIYSVAFAFATVIRRTALSIVSAVFVMLVLYFVPPLVPGLQYLSIGRVTDDLGERHQNELPTAHMLTLHASYPVFVTVMILVAAVFLLLALLVIKRDWQVEASRKSIAWGIGGCALLLSLSASLQLGTNMPLLQTIELDPHEHARRLLHYGDGTSALLLTSQWNDRYWEQPVKRMQFVRRITFGQQVTIGPKMVVTLPENSGEFGVSASGDILYGCRFSPVPDPRALADQYGSLGVYPVLVVIPLSNPTPESHSFELKQLALTDWGQPVFVINGSTLTILAGKHEMIFDVADPLHPKLQSTKVLTDWVGYRGLAPTSRDPDQIFQFRYDPACDVTADQLLKAYNESYWFPGSNDGTRFIRETSGGIACYTRGDAFPGFINFRIAGRYTRLPIEQLTAYQYNRSIVFNGDLVATSGAQTSGVRTTLYDVSNPARPRAIGHYAAPKGSESVLGILPDGRVLAGDKRLIVLGNPGT